MTERIDRLEEMWKQQQNFVRLLQKERGFPDFPVDITSKNGQQFLKTISHWCMDELFESNLCLKNSKFHKKTDDKDIDRTLYIEEISDCLHFLFELTMAAGVSLDELYESYMSKGEKNEKKILEGF